MGPKNADRRNETKPRRHLPPTSFPLRREKEKFLNIIVA